MRLIASTIRAALLSGVLLGGGLLPTVAIARQLPSGTPSRIDNIWGGRAHQPTEAEVRSREHADPAAQRAADAEVNQLYQQLMTRSAG
jgi:hypothetical protein